MTLYIKSISRIMQVSAVLREHSKLVCFSSDFAQSKDDTFKNGWFRCVINNTSHLPHTVKVVPQEVVVPNIFDNVNMYNDTLTITDLSGNVLTAGTFTHAFYTTADFLSDYNAAFGGYVTLTQNASGKISVFHHLPSQGCQLRASLDFFELLGFQSLVKSDNGKDYILEVTPGTIINLNANTTKPNFSGEPYVFINTKEISPDNLLASQGLSFNILKVVPLADVPHGGYAAISASDLYIHDVQYTNRTNLSSVEIQVLDHKFRVISIPENHPVTVILKVFYLN